MYPFKNARQNLDGVIKYPPPAMDRVKDNLKNEDDVRKEDSLEMKTHTAPPLRPSVVLVSFLPLKSDYTFKLTLFSLAGVNILRKLGKPFPKARNKLFPKSYA